jgi:hypothetical protein
MAARSAGSEQAGECFGNHEMSRNKAARRATAAGWLATLCEHQGGPPFACLVSLRRGRDWSSRTGRLLCFLLTELGRHAPRGLGLPHRGTHKG